MENSSPMGSGIPLPMSLIMLVLAIPVLVGAYQGIKTTQKALVKTLLSLVLLLGVGWLFIWTLVLLGEMT